jgi:hypothetical protein
MDWQTTVRRLQNHANLPGYGGEHESFVFALFIADRESKPPNLSALSEDVLGCLGIINAALNNTKSLAENNFRAVAYAVAAILSSSLEYLRRWRDQGRFSESTLRDLELRAWRIAVGWEQVLAGDIEDLKEDLALEEAARFPKSVP